MCKYDTLIQGGNAYYGGGRVEEGVDIALKDGKIAAVAAHIPPEAAAEVIDAKGKLVSPAFMDTHMHIDEAFTMDDDDTLSLLAAIDNQEKSNAKYFDWDEDRLLAMMLENAGRVVEMCIKNGTQLLKTNVLFTPAWKTTALTAMTMLREKYKGRLDLKTCCGVTSAFRDEILARAKNGEVDFVSGYPYMDEEYWTTVDTIFETAQTLGLPIDIHSGESDVPDIDCFLYALRQTRTYGMQGKVSCGHVTSLSATGISEAAADAAVALASEVKLNVTSLTSCNLYLSSENRRGPTLVRKFLDAGVNVAVASDNIRDTFRPYGNCDLLEEALLTAKVHQFATDAELRCVFDMVTYNAAKNALAEGYGLAAGSAASLVVLNAPTPEEAILSQAAKLYVLKDGKTVAKSGVLV